MAHMDGMTLRLRRVAADVKARDLAVAMGVGASRVAHIEKLRIVTDEAAARYIQALDMCVAKSTEGRSAA